MAKFGSRLLQMTAFGLLGLLVLHQTQDGFLSQATASDDLAKGISRSIFAFRGQSAEPPDIVTGATDTPPAADTEAKSKAAGSEPSEKEPNLPVVNDPEKLLLERLAARRDAIEKRDKELNEREAVLAAAEKQIEAKMAEMKAMDDALKADFAKKDADVATMKPLIVMYEAMKPKDAARIFEKMDLKSALPIASGMNPKKFSEVLAQIDPVIAGKMTVALSSLANGQTQTAGGKQEITELPDLPGVKTR